MRHIQLMAIGGAIGTGLFIGSGTSIKITGPGIIFIYSLIGALLFLIMRAMGELLVSQKGYQSFLDPISYYLGDAGKFVSGWTYWLCWMIIGIADIVGINQYLKLWFPNTSFISVSLTCVAMLFILNSLAVKWFGETEFWLVIIKVLAIISIIATSFFLVIKSVFYGQLDLAIKENTNLFPNGYMGFLRGFQMTAFAFVGTEMVGTAVAETQNAHLSLKKAINSIPIRICIFYILTIFSILLIMPWYEVPVSQSPFVALYLKANLPIAANLFNIVVISSAFSSVNSGLYAGNRMLLGLAKDKHAPSFCTMLSSRQVPQNSLILSCLFLVSICTLLHLDSDFIKVFTFITTVATVLFSFIWLMILAAYIVYKKKNKERSSYRLPGGLTTCYLCIASLGIVLAILAYFENTRWALIAATTWIAALFLIFFCIRKLTTC